jgi:PAS domain-containing protein
MKYLRKATHALRLRGPLADDPRARVLHALAVCLLLHWFARLLMVWQALFTRSNLVGATIDLLVFGVVLILLRRGFQRSATWWFLTTTWLHATYLITVTGGIHSPILVEYIAAPILGTWLAGPRGATVVASVCLASSLTMAILAQMGVRLPGFRHSTPFALWYQFVEATLIAAAPLAAVLRALTRAREAQRSPLQLLNSIINSITDCISLKDRDLRTVMCNPAFAQLLGRSVADVIGRTVIENGWDPQFISGDAAQRSFCLRKGRP